MRFTTPRYLKEHVTKRHPEQADPENDTSLNETEVEINANPNADQSLAASNGGERKKYKCQHCDQLFLNKSSIFKHRRNVHPETMPRDFECTKCDRGFRYERNLTEHMKKEHDEKSGENEALPTGNYKCSKCDFDTAHFKLLVKHFKIHVDPTGSFPCLLCTAEFELQPEVISHIKTEHTSEFELMKNGSKGKELIQCPQCDFKSPDEVDMSKHHRTHETLGKRRNSHTWDSSYSCPKCQSFIGTFSECTFHAIKNHCAKDSLKDKEYPCFICFKAFKSLVNAKIHSTAAHRAELRKLEITPVFSPVTDEPSKHGKKLLKATTVSFSSSSSGSSAEKRKSPKSFDLDFDSDADDTFSETTDEVTGNDEPVVEAKTDDKLACQHCPKTFKQKAALNMHMKKAHMGVTDVTGAVTDETADGESLNKSWAEHSFNEVDCVESIYDGN